LVRVAIAAGAYPYDQVSRRAYIALSIDEPIPTEFLADAPEKIWCLYPYDSGYGASPYLYPKILDIPAGTHTIYLAVYSPPEVPWKMQVAVYGTTDTYGVKSYESTWLYKGVTDSFTVEISSTGAPYYNKPRFPIFNIEYIYDGLTAFGYRVCEMALSDIFPRLFSALGCYGQYGFECVARTGRMILYSTLSYISASKGEQFVIRVPMLLDYPIYTYSHFWWAVKEANYPLSSRRVSLYPVKTPCPDIEVDFCGETCPVVPLPGLSPHTPPLYLARNLTSADNITLQIGHIENDTLPPDQWAYVLDREYTFNIGARIGQCQTPPPPTNISFRLNGIGVGHEAPIDIRPGRRLFIAAYITNTGSMGFWPYMSIAEGPAIFKVAEPAPYLPVGETGTVILSTVVDSQIASQKYVTLYLGYYAPADYPSGTLVGTMKPVILQTIQVPLSVRQADIWNVKLETFSPYSARIDNVSLQAIAPAKAARIDDVTLEAIAPAKAARIDNVSLEAIAPTRAARIDNVSLSAVAPPAEYATIAGRVLGFLGPVANAEVSLDTKYTTKTKADGSYTLTNIPLGTYTLTAKPTSLLDKILYSPASTKVDALAPVTITKNITLPTNWTSLAAGAGGISIAAVVAATKIKPKPPAVY